MVISASDQISNRRCLCYYQTAIVAASNPGSSNDFSGLAHGAKLAIYDCADAVGRIRLPADLTAEVFTKG
jgi:hypothetical protein